MIQQALKLARRGVAVFPVQLCPNACLKCNTCKAPFPGSRGFKDASSDPAEIQALWRKYPGALVGAVTGDRFDVLDVDSVKHPEAVVWWMSNHRRIPQTRTHQTGSGGLHVLFKHNTLARTGNGRLGPGIDVKAAGAYVVWWPAFGRKVISDAPLSKWPDWLIAAQQPKPLPPMRRGTGATNLDPVASFVASLPEGQRNSGTFWGMCRALDAAAEGGVGETEAIHTITDAALRNGLPESEVRAIARSARMRAGRGNGRH
jgi:hypothetical protein